MPIVLAAMQDKDMDAHGAPTAAAGIGHHYDRRRTPRAFAPEALASRVKALAPGADVTAVTEPRAAVARALALERRAVAAGSIYFVGPLRARLIESGATPI